MVFSNPRSLGEKSSSYSPMTSGSSSCFDEFGKSSFINCVSPPPKLIERNRVLFTYVISRSFLLLGLPARLLLTPSSLDLRKKVNSILLSVRSY